MSNLENFRIRRLLPHAVVRQSSRTVFRTLKRQEDVGPSALRLRLTCHRRRSPPRACSSREGRPIQRRAPQRRSSPCCSVCDRAATAGAPPAAAAAAAGVLRQMAPPPSAHAHAALHRCVPSWIGQWAPPSGCARKSGTPGISARVFRSSFLPPHRHGAGGVRACTKRKPPPPPPRWWWRGSRKLAPKVGPVFPAAWPASEAPTNDGPFGWWRRPTGTTALGRRAGLSGKAAFCRHRRNGREKVNEGREN